MSTEFTLLDEDNELSMTERSAKFDLELFVPIHEDDDLGPECVVIANQLTPEQIEDIAVRMLQVVSYSYPERTSALLERIKREC